MEPRYLMPYVKRLVAASRAMEQAILANDPELVVAAHEAVGRVRERLGPSVGYVAKGIAAKDAKVTAAPAAAEARVVKVVGQ